MSEPSLDDWLSNGEQMYEIAKARFEQTSLDLATLTARHAEERRRLNLLGTVFGREPIGVPQPATTKVKRAYKKRIVEPQDEPDEGGFNRDEQ